METLATSAAADAATLSAHVPMTFRRRGGQKLIVVPNDAPPHSTRPRDESRLVKLLARAFYWKRLIDTGEYATVADLAAAEKVDKSNLGKVLRLTLLAPDIIEAILSEAEFNETQVGRLLKPFPAEWEKQRPWFAAQTCESRGQR